MVRVGAAPDAIVADQAKSDGPINGPINKRVLQFVREHAGCKRADIANGIGVSLRSLKRALEGLSAEIQYRGSNDVGIFVEWVYDWPSKPEDGEDNPRTLSFKEVVENVVPRQNNCGTHD